MVTGTTGGDDRITGGDDSQSNTAYGDAVVIDAGAVCGNDSLTGGANTVISNALYGDAYDLWSDGGNDTLIGGANATINFLHGDAYTMYTGATGGDDILIGNDFCQDNQLYGDAAVMLDGTIGGDDTLISGRGFDSMTGDSVNKGANVTTGADTFVFAPRNGQDAISDFEIGKDLIDLAAYGYDDISDFTVLVSGGDSVLSFTAADDVTVLGVTGLTNADFVFA